MNENWDLDILYRGFDDPKHSEDMERLRAAAAAFATLSHAADTKKTEELVREYVDLQEEMNEIANRLGEYASFVYAADTNNVRAQSSLEQIMNVFSGIAGEDASLRRRIAGMEDLEQIIRSDPGLNEYSYYLSNIRRDSRYLLTDREETLFAKMNISGAKGWEDLQSSQTSSVKADYRGSQITLSEVRNLAYDPDPSVRKDAYEAEVACYGKICTPVAFALNNIKMQVLTECELRGYPSPLAKTLEDSRMRQETLDALLEAIGEYKGKFHEYLRAKAELLGLEGSLPWWDMFAPVGKNDRKFTVEEARDYLVSHFSEIDPDIGDLMRTAFSDSWIDFYPREGKVGGAFDEAVPSVKQSRVLTNFDGSFSDIVTLAHELGHAFHDRQVFAHKEICQSYSMPVAETASTFNEVLIVSKAIEEAEDPEEKLFLIESQLCDAAQIICDILSRFLFEKSVFEGRKDEFMGSETLCGMMRDAQAEAYGDGLDEKTLHPYMWVCKGHYYSGSLSFYNFPYAFGGLLARGLYEQYRILGGKEFFPRYKQMLRNTSVMDVEDCLAVMGIDLTKKEFWESGLRSLADEIDVFCRMVREKKA